MSTNKDHDRLATIIATEMQQSGRYKEVHTMYEYNNNMLHGEFDVLGIISKRDARYVEVKSNDCEKNYKKAILQFDRARKAFPYINWEFEYATPTCRKIYENNTMKEKRRF